MLKLKLTVTNLSKKTKKQLPWFECLKCKLFGAILEKTKFTHKNTTPESLI